MILVIFMKRVLDRNRWVSCNESDIVSDSQCSAVQFLTHSLLL